jgi:hypothetical protein
LNYMIINLPYPQLGKTTVPPSFSPRTLHLNTSITPSLDQFHLKLYTSISASSKPQSASPHLSPSLGYQYIWPCRNSVHHLVNYSLEKHSSNLALFSLALSSICICSSSEVKHL